MPGDDDWPGVLLVEDRPETIRHLVLGLGRRQLVVEVATEGATALRLIAARRSEGHPYALVLSDLVMPGVNGWQLLERLRDDGDEVPFAFMTGYRPANPGLDWVAAELRVAAILEKPVDLAAVEALVERTLGRPLQDAVKAATPAPAAGDAPEEDLLPDEWSAPEVLQPQPGAPEPVPSGTTRLYRQPAQARPGVSTARIRRGVDGVEPGSGTAVIRRDSGLGRRHICTACGYLQLATVRAVAYEMPCTRCGRPQRIVPA